MIYLDASALVKLAVVEEETAALESWLKERPRTVTVTTDLATTEVPRAVMRSEPTALLQAHAAVARTRRVAVTSEILATAASLQPPALRSLDAIHLASALRLRTYLTDFVAYDDRLHQAARDFELPVVQPK